MHMDILTQNQLWLILLILLYLIAMLLPANSVSADLTEPYEDSSVRPDPGTKHAVPAVQQMKLAKVEISRCASGK